MCRSIVRAQIASQKRICKSEKPFLAVKFCALKNTVKLRKHDLAVQNNPKKCTVKIVNQHLTRKIVVACF